MQDEIKRLQNELICAAQHARGCDCVTLNSVLEDSEIIAAYETAIEALKNSDNHAKALGFYATFEGEPYCIAYVCTGCHKFLPMKYSYCPHCGRKLEWEE